MTIERRILRFVGAQPAEVTDRLVVEEPLEIRLGSTPIAVVMRTPGDDEDLVLGFLLTEGIMLTPDEVGVIEPIDDNRIRVEPAPGVDIDPERFRRNLYTTSSCGVCGKASIDAVRVATPVIEHLPPDAAMLHGLPAALLKAQKTFADTGGLHAAGLFDEAGTLLEMREDIGRHNAVDKAIGAYSADTWPLRNRLLLVSGRISFEIVQKAAVAGIGAVAGISAASSLAVDLGEELGMTIVGFLRDGTFNLYTGSVAT